MLMDLLREIGQSKAFSKSQLSKKLNISETMVEDLLGQLIRMGYLTEDLGSPSCETYCGRCPYAKSCNINPVKVYNISEKGKSLLN